MLVGKSEAWGDGERDRPRAGTVGEAERERVPKCGAYSDDGDRARGGKSKGGVEAVRKGEAVREGGGEAVRAGEAARAGGGGQETRSAKELGGCPT